MKTPTVSIALAALLLAAPRAQDPDIFAILEADRASPWRVLGPFPSARHQGLETAFINETATTFEDTAVDENGTELTWRRTEQELPDGGAHDLSFTGGGDWDTVYLSRTIEAIADHDAVLGIGMDDSAALWVNGNEVFRKHTEHAVQVDQYLVKVHLHAGTNPVLFKVVNQRGGFAFAFRITDRLDTGSRWGAGLPGDGLGGYEVTDVPVPANLHMEVGGLLFLPDDSLLVCCRRGWIYRIENPAESDPAKIRITTFAEGLHEPLGMMLDDDGSILVAQKPELTRVRDTDGDGRADSFETVTAAWGMSGNYHEYHYGPVRDGHGDLWGTLNIGFPSGHGDQLRYRGSAYRLRGGERFEITCYGLRSPNGLMTNAAGEVFYTDNQGEWMDVCRLAWLRPKKYYGHMVPVEWAKAMPDFGWETERTLPAVWLPYHLVRSASLPLLDTTGGRFGPYTGQIIIADQNNSLLVRTTLEKVGGEYQGACYPFWQAFAGGINRLAFDRHGVLYVGFTNRGWGSVRSRGEGLQRMRYVGPEPFDLREVNVTHDGWDLHFTKPLAPDSVVTPRTVLVREYGYRWWSTYGSDEFDSRRIEVLGVRISDDRKTVSLTTAERQVGKAFQIALRGKVVSEDGQRPIAREAFYTLLHVP